MREITRIERKEAQTMNEVIAGFIQEMKLASGLNRQRIFAAWDEVSGAGAHTVGRFVKNGVLYCNISSSVLRNQLSFQKEEILKKMNEFLEADELFVKGDRQGPVVRNIVLR